MADRDEFAAQLLDALRRSVQGDAEPRKSLWSHRDDVTIFGGWGACEQGWAGVEPRLDWAASRYSEGWFDRENLLEGVDQDIAYSVDIERSGGRFDNAPDARQAPLRVTHLFRRENGEWRIVHRHADFLQPRQEPRLAPLRAGLQATPSACSAALGARRRTHPEPPVLEQSLRFSPLEARRMG